MRELGTGLRQGLLREACLRYILNRTYVFEFTIGIATRRRDKVHIFYPPVRHYEAILIVDVGAHFTGVVYDLKAQMRVLRMKAAHDHIEGHRKIGIELVMTVSLL